MHTIHATKTVRTIEGTANFFDRKNDTGDWSIECRSDPGGATGKNQPSLHQPTLEVSPAIREVHEARTGMNGGAFAADRHSGKQANGKKQPLAHKNTPGKNMIAGRTVLDLQRSNGLRDPGAIGATKEAVA